MFDNNLEKNKLKNIDKKDNLKFGTNESNTINIFFCNSLVF